MTAGVTLPPSYCEDILYASYVDRLLVKSLGVQAGVVETEDYRVSPGTGLQVNVKSGKAFVEETKAIEETSNAFYNGLYNVLNPTEQNPYNNVEVSAVNPQIAQIILRVYDVGELKIGGSSYARIEWLNGSPNANATEAKMKEGKYEGRAVLPQSSFRLANVLVPKNASKSSEYYIENVRALCQKPSLRNEYTSAVTNYSVKIGEMAIAEKEGGVIRLPEIPTNEGTYMVGVYSKVNNVTVQAGSEEFIIGDFITEGNKIILNKNQHVVLSARGNLNTWYIVAGEPKSENTYGTFASKEFGTKYKPSSSRMTQVNVWAEITNAFEGFRINVYVGGVLIASVQEDTSVKQAPIVSFNFLCPPGLEWEVTKQATSGEAKGVLEASYLLL